MPDKKYITNSGTQSIIGNVSITGNLTVSGTVSTPIGIYRALLTHTGNIVGTNITDFNSGLIVGETYTITNYVSGDDFSNIANIQSGAITETGCVFIATGEIPDIWSYSSELSSSGDLVVDVLENTLGFNIDWVYSPFGGSGYYIGFESLYGPMINRFPRKKTDIKVGIKYPFNYGPSSPIPISGIGTFIEKDGHIFIDMYGGEGLVANSMYYTPVEIKMNKDIDTTPIQVYGLNVDSFPYGNPSVRLYSGNNPNSIATYYSSNTVNNIYELVTNLNNDSDTNFLGIYSVNHDIEDGIILTMATNLKNQFSPNATLTFEAFND